MAHSRTWYLCRAAWRRLALRREGAYISMDIEQPAPCELCGTPTHQVHHLFPVSQRYDLEILFDPLFGLVACQEPCHAMYHHTGHRKRFWQMVEAAVSSKDPVRWAAIATVRDRPWRPNQTADEHIILMRLERQEQEQIAQQELDQADF